MTRRLDIVYFDVTSGHRSAALALARTIEGLGRGVEVRVVNLVDLLAHHRLLRGLAVAGINFFNWGMRNELALLPEQQIAFFQTIQRRLPHTAELAIANFWRDRPVDAVVSVIPICNLFLERAFHLARPACPYLVVPVDLEEGMASYWFDPEADAHYLAASPRLVEQASAAGIPAARLTALAGMPIDPSFYDPPRLERAAALREAGLAPEHPTVLVSFGGQGSTLVEQCAARLRGLGSALNVIFLCGRDASTRRRVARLATPYRKLVLGFIEEPPARYYALADLVVGKPGSMTLTEALVMRKPLVAISSHTLAVVQRGNEAWIRATGVGEVVTLGELAAAIERVLGNSAMRLAIERRWHRGVFEAAQRVLQIADDAAAATDRIAS